MFALSGPGKPRTSVHKPDALMVCWIVLNPLQSSAPLAVGLALAAADPLNDMASTVARRTPTSVAVMRRRGASRLIFPSPLEVLRFGAFPRPVAGAPCPRRHPDSARRS